MMLRGLELSIYMHFFEERKIERLAKRRKKRLDRCVCIVQLLVEPAVCSAVRAMEKAVVCARTTAWRSERGLV